MLFIVYSFTNNVVDFVWFLDSGCSNHISCSNSLFRELDEVEKSIVRLGDDKVIKVEGKSTIVIKTNHDNTKLLTDVQFVY